MFDRLQQLAQRLPGYAWWQVVVEVAIIWAAVYIVVRFIETARASRSLKGLFYFFVIATLLIRILGAREAYQRLSFLYDTVLPVAVLALLVIFQPELRRALMRAGDFSFLRRRVSPETAVVEEIVQACRYLSRSKFGGLIVIERETPLKNLIEAGTVLNAEVTAPLLQTIFFPGSALHDLAVVIKGRQIVAAGVQLPLAEASEMDDQQLGSRHRAAVGVSQETDAVVVIVSEETGIISIAERGELTRGLNEDELRSLLILKYNRGLVRRMTTAARTDEPETTTSDNSPFDGATQPSDRAA